MSLLQLLKQLAFFFEKPMKHKILIKNFSYLSALQVFNMLIPLVTYPYLIRILGKETYGLVIFAQAIVGYLVILVGFGFNMTATKEISIHRNNKAKLNEIISGILIIKSIFFLLSFLILFLLIYFLPQAHNHKLLFIFTMWMCFYDVIFPIWYFQGLEKMSYITFITLLSRSIFLILIFIFIKNEHDYIYFPVINGIGAIFAGTVSLLIIFNNHQNKFILPPINSLFYYFKDSLPIFASNVSIKIYLTTNKVLIGTLLGMSEVAYYDLAEKIITLFRIPQAILSQALFPKIAIDKNIEFIKRIFKISLSINLLFTFIVILLSSYIVKFVGGPQMFPAVNVIYILSFTIPILAASSFLGIQILIPFGFHKEYSKSIILAGISYFLIIIFLWATENISLFSLAYLTLWIELLVVGIMYFYCQKIEPIKQDLFCKKKINT